MNRYSLTYRYSNPRATIAYVVASIEFLATRMDALDLVHSLPLADPKLRVIGIEVAA